MHSHIVKYALIIDKNYHFKRNDDKVFSTIIHAYVYSLLMFIYIIYSIDNRFFYYIEFMKLMTPFVMMWVLIAYHEKVEFFIKMLMHKKFHKV